MPGMLENLMENTDEQLGFLLLETLYDQARADVPATPSSVAPWLDVSLPKVMELLTRLDRQGLIDAKRCRLTMKGLVLAVSMAGSRKVAQNAA